MPISQTDLLFKLIKSLTKAEKRNFRLHVNKGPGSDNVKFVQLFDILDKMKKYDDQEIYKKFTGLEKSKFSNLKRHLYSQILTSLRQISIQKNIDIQIREQIDFAKILYEKGLYLQSLKLLERTKTIAYKTHQDYLHLEILEFEKIIQSRHITRNKDVDRKVNELTTESFHRSKVIFNLAQLTNLKLKIHALYLNKGHVTREADIEDVEKTFEENMPRIKYAEMTFFERVYFHQSKVWYYLILQNSIYCYKHAISWVELFNLHPNMKEKDPMLYMQGLHYVLIATYNMGYHSKFKAILKEFEDFKEPQSMNLRTNARILSFIYRYTSRLNQHFLEGTFDEGLDLPKRITMRIQRYRIHLDAHRTMVFYYKIACLYLGSGMPGKAIDFLNKVIDLDVKHLREDIRGYSRLLFLVAHYEAGNHLFLEHQVKSTERFFNRQDSMSKVQTATLRFFTKFIKCNPDKKIQLITQFHKELLEIKKNPYEQRSFAYLDLTFWTESKLKATSLQQVIREHFQKNIAKTGKLASSGNNPQKNIGKS